MKIILTVLFLIIMSPVIYGQDKSKSKSVLHYLVHQPKIKSVKPPLIILLHGIGSNETDLFSLADKLPANFLVVSARAPNTISQGSYAWYHADFSTDKPIFNKKEAEKSRNTIIQFITELKKQLLYDDKQVYLCGFSQGAIMSYSVALTRPDLVKGIAVMSGRLLEEVKPLIVSKEKIQSLRVFISHGTNDNVLRIQYARESEAYLKTLNINSTYKEYPEGHGINNAMFNDLVTWLKAN